MRVIDPLAPPSSRQRPTEWHRASATEMRAALESGRVTSRELVDAHLERIPDVDRELGAFTELLRDEALAAAESLDAERRESRVRGPLHGIPVSVKECYELAGHSTSLGVASRREPRARRDASMVRALIEAGAIVIGRTNLAQLLTSYESDNPVFGRTTNPWSPRHSSGGSSGGDAAAVAAGLVPIGIGTDLGGSIRIPAHCCGVAALLPTPNRLPNGGIARLLAGEPRIPVQAAPLARSVADLELVLDALPATTLSALDARVPPATDPAAPALSGLRVGMFTEDGLLAPSSAVVGAVERAADALRAAGATVMPFRPPALDEVFIDFVALVSAEGGHELVRALGDGAVAESLKPMLQLVRMPAAVRAGLAQVARVTGDRDVARLLAAIGEVDVGELYATHERLDRRRQDILDALDASGIDALLCPPYALPAVPHGASGELFVAGSYAAVWNAVGFPAGVVPVTRVHGAEARRDTVKGRLGRLARRVDEQSAGLPVGVQVVARPWRDRSVLALLAAIERNVKSDVDFPRTPVW